MLSALSANGVDWLGMLGLSRPDPGSRWADPAGTIARIAAKLHWANKKPTGQNTPVFNPVGLRCDATPGMAGLQFTASSNNCMISESASAIDVDGFARFGIQRR